MWKPSLQMHFAFGYFRWIQERFSRVKTLFPVKSRLFSGTFCLWAGKDKWLWYGVCSVWSPLTTSHGVLKTYSHLDPHGYIEETKSTFFCNILVIMKLNFWILWSWKSTISRFSAFLSTIISRFVILKYRYMYWGKANSLDISFHWYL